MLYAVLLSQLTEITDIFYDVCAESAFNMTVTNNAAIGIGRVLCFRPPHFVDGCISSWSSHLDARLFAILFTGPTLTVVLGQFEPDTAYVAWRCRWKHAGGQCAVDDRTDTNSMNTHFPRFVWEVLYE